MSLLQFFLNSTGVSTDTRKIEKGNIFFALKGENFNGNLFALQALKAGASFVVVDENIELIEVDDFNKSIIKVDNCLVALQELAMEYRRHLDIPVLGITGSNGKTTSKELIASVLSKKYNLNYTKGNLNNEIGVPLTILSTSRECNFLIVEMGANHQGEIHLLSKIAQPNFGYITNIGKAHLEGFGGIEGVKRGKSELYRYLEKSEGLIFLNSNDQVLSSLVPAGSNIYSFDSSTFEVVNNFPTLSLQLENEKIQSNLVGVYNINNIAAAYFIGKYFGIENNLIIEAIESYQPNNNRSQLVEKDGVQLIMDAYNANPSSVMSSLQSLFQTGAKDKIVILGDMLELGEYSEQEHKNVLDFLIKSQIEKVFLVGPIYFSLQDNFTKFNYFKNVNDLKEEFDLGNFKNYTMLVKGSRGIALEKLFN